MIYTIKDEEGVNYAFEKNLENVVKYLLKLLDKLDCKLKVECELV